jgi:hypothetical protein
LALIARLPTHHGKPPPLMSQATESLFAENHEHFFNSIDPNRTFRFLSGGLTQRAVSVFLATFAAGRASRVLRRKIMRVRSGLLLLSAALVATLAYAQGTDTSDPQRTSAALADG